MNDLITTAEAARIAGVGVSSIKRWADQSLIQAVRTPGGHRRIIKSALLRFLQEGGTPLRDVRGHRDSSVASDPKDSGTGDSSPVAGAVWADELLEGDVYEIQASLLNARSRLGSWFPTADEVCLGLREIGNRWVSGDISVLDEHVASERLGRAISIIAHSMPTSSSDPVCVLACAANESHTLGLSLLQICLLEAGWQPLWVGANTPTEYVCKAAEPEDVKMVALSASQASSDARALAKIGDEVGACCKESRADLVLGGSGKWPDTPSYGYRFLDFAAFASYLQARG